MHQRRNPTTTRFMGAFGAAMVIATALVVVTASAECFPLCALYDEWDVLWYIFQCWQCGGR